MVAIASASADRLAGNVNRQYTANAKLGGIAMNDQVAAVPERDPRFPGGSWTGFYLQHWMPGRHKMDLGLTWRGHWR